MLKILTCGRGQVLSLLAILNPAHDIMHPLSPPTDALPCNSSQLVADAPGRSIPGREDDKGRVPRGVGRQAHALSTAGRSAGKVVVVGAGFAGVSAARRLRGWGYEVVVMEAQNRTGGRVWSRPWPSGEGLGAVAQAGGAGVVDLGGMVVTGTQGNPLVSLARSYGVALRA